ncbi:MAG: hypothetical protein MUF48_10205 [Pirellulaceae bacterium]|nr:hypothetical protein [Pirellulaceae bacterium]
MNRPDQNLHAADAHTDPSRREFLGSTLAALAAAGVLSERSAATAQTPASASPSLWVGTASADITPPLPAALTGFQTVRIARTIQSPLQANVVAVESRAGDRALDQLIMVSCDLCIFRPGIQDEFRRYVAGRVPEVDPRKLILAATHTHSAPVLRQSQYDESSYGDATQPKDYLPMLYERLADAVAQAWQSRAVGSVAWGLGHAVVGHNRRLVYADGHAEMLGNTNQPGFRQVEGYEDHAVDVLGFYDDHRRLTALAISLACPAQMSQSEGVVSADFWHDAREALRAQYGSTLAVLGFCAPAGDQCPHLSLRQRGEARMDRLRGLSRTQELGRRIARSVADTADVMGNDIRTDAPLMHTVQDVELPARIVTDAEFATAKSVCDAIDAKPQAEGWDTWVRHLYGEVCDRYHAQQDGRRAHAVEVHVARLGDVAIATNPFELYLDYGIQMQARSASEQTFLIQLAAAGKENPGYLPTTRAVAGGGFTEAPMNNYSATVMSNLIGPEGGQVLVDRTVESIARLFA